MFLSVLAFIVAVGFLVQSLRTQRYRSSIPFALLCLFSFWIGLIFLPVSIPDALIIGFGWLVVFMAGVFLVFDGVYFLVEKILHFKWFTSRFTAKLAPELLELCRALEHMASKHTGALIVLERKDPLEPLMGNALRLDAEIKAELLISIFQTTAPIHDGAVVIIKNRIRAAKMILPLARRSDIPFNIGTRHRSALGITERTDAIALVVSEEKGVMSVAYEGVLVAAPDIEKLAELLQLALRGKVLPQSRSEKQSAEAAVHAAAR